MMRFLSISLFILVVSCRSYPKKQHFLTGETKKSSIYNPYFSDPSKDYVYKAKITVFKKNFGGIFIVKKLGKENHRVVFTTEMGNKIFDFSFIKGQFTINFILDEINKTAFIKLLKKDFLVLITENPKTINQYSNDALYIYGAEINHKKYYYYYSPKNQLTKIVRPVRGKKKTTFSFSDLGDGTARDIVIVHPKIKLKIILKKL